MFDLQTISEIVRQFNEIKWVLLVEIIFEIFAGIVAAVLLYLGMVGYYNMFKKAGSKRPYFAFIPFLNQYGLGECSDALVTDGGKKNYKWVLTVLYCLAEICALVSGFIFLKLLVDIINKFVFTLQSNLDIELAFTPAIVLKMTTPLLITACLLALLSLVYIIFYYICLYRVYKIYSQSSAAGLLVLAILIPVSRPIIAYVLGRKDPVLNQCSYIPSSPMSFELDENAENTAENKESKEETGSENE